MVDQPEKAIPSRRSGSGDKAIVVLSGLAGVVLLSGLLTAIAVGAVFQAAAIGVSLLVLAVVALLGARRHRHLAAASDDLSRNWQTSIPEIQRESLNLEVAELSRLLDVGPEQSSDLQSAYIVAQDLALRQIQQEEEAPLFRHVTVGKASFDGVLVNGDVVDCIEVAFLVVPDIRQERLDAMLRKAAIVKRSFAQAGSRLKVRLMIILVTQLTPEDEDRLRSVLNTKRFAETPVDIDIRLLDFEALQRVYVTD